MLAVAPEPPLLIRARVSAPALRRALVSGMRRVIRRRDHLNKINVFPVPDGDTGSNLAFTLNTVLSGSLSRRATSVGALLRAVADDAIDGARGNSGAILAQFLCGIGETVGDAQRLDTQDIAHAVQAGARQARSALAQPREGTILSVIQAFSEALQSPADDLSRWFGQAVVRARKALADTPRQLAVLRQAGVVDAGAQGFVDLLEGIQAFIVERRIAAPEHDPKDLAEDTFAGGHWHEEADPARPWCSECLVSAESIDHAALKAALDALGADSVVVAGGSRRVRLHAHVADPGVLFDLAVRFGAVTARKADNMRAQHRAATRQSQVTIVTDSASDLPDGLLDHLPLDTVPVRVSFGDEDFLDRISISNAEFYRRLREGPVLPQTSQPPPGDFRRQFELALAHAGQVVYVGLSRPLSGTLQSGETAAERFGPDRVTVIDSGQASCGQALMAIAAAECAAAGGDVATIRGRLAQLKPHTFTFAAARDIQHAVRGGRIPRWALPLANGLGLTAIARMRPNGKLSLAGALFGRSNVPTRFAHYVAKRLPKGARWRVMVGHCDAAEDARQLSDALRRILPVERDWLVETGPAIGAHAGPGSLVVGIQAVLDPAME
ncbi:DegV family EDD domain-containing protein [Xanthomonadaceae bacterium JHOS43]|nr:DegV family EDD domain-containing protein [Xanthomonadaceae bacterium JHOS43]